jgi:cation diffusion facilitator CzcD-associated flavoprotein CzcO
MAIKLKMAGYNNFTIFDKSSNIGGTWNENTYPDCGCDVPSGLYSYSYENYPDWDRVWSKQSQILYYQNHCVKKYNLISHIKLNSMMRACDWDEYTSTWKLQIEEVGKGSDSGKIYEVTSTYVVMAQGTLHVPQFPNIRGVNIQNGDSCFQGKSFHTAEWDHSVNLEGKRVGVIGSGASAIQLVPEVAKVAKELYVFQRTAPYVQYKSDFPIPRVLKYIFRYVPFSMTILRYSLYIATEIRFSALYSNSWMSKWIKWDNIRYLKSIIKDPVLQKKLIPPYQLGCKRMLFSSFWYPALIKPNVHVVTDRLVGVRKEGIVVDTNSTGVTASQNKSDSTDPLSTKLIDLDVIVYSTGFQYTRANAPRKHMFDVTGQQATSLTKVKISLCVTLLFLFFISLFVAICSGSKKVRRVCWE